MSGALVVALALASPPSPQTAPPRPPVTELEDVLVLGAQGRAEVAAEVEIGPAEIDALNLWSIGELATRLSEFYADPEPPVIIINGRRVADPGLYFSLPPDALRSAEVLPPGSAGAFGGPVSGRAINLVLAQRFGSLDGELRAHRPSAGGLTGVALSGRANRLAGLEITALTLGATRTTALFGDERPGVMDGRPDAGAATLTPASRSYTAQFALGRSLGDWNLSLNANARQNESRSTIVVEGGPVDQASTNRIVGAVTGLSGRALDWDVSASLRAQTTEARREGLSSTTSEGRLFDLSLNASRSFPLTPAGPATVSLEAGGNHSTSETRGDVVRDLEAETRSWSARLSIPLLGGPAPVLGGPVAPRGRPGGLDLALAVGRQTGRAGQGDNLHLGLTGRFGPGVRVNASWTRTTAAPGEADRFAPAYDGPPTLVYDFRNGRTEQVFTIEGGAPDLRASVTDATLLGASIGPMTALRFSMGASLGARRGRDGIVRDLAATPENEALFPERFLRSDDGRLLAVDRRPLNLAGFRDASLDLTAAVTLPEGPILPAPVQLRLRHSQRLEDRFSIVPGSPELDRLAGDSGGAPGASSQLELTSARGRWTMNLTGRRQGAYRVRRIAGRDGEGDILYAPWASLDLRLGFTLSGRGGGGDGDDQRRQSPGARIELQIDNLLDGRRQARLADGSPPSGWNADRNDPVGRTLRLRLSQRF